MKTQNKRPSADFSQLPNFKIKKSPLNDSFQAALHENHDMPTIQEMETVIFLAELVKRLEKLS